MASRPQTQQGRQAASQAQASGTGSTQASKVRGLVQNTALDVASKVLDQSDSALKKAVGTALGKAADVVTVVTFGLKAQKVVEQAPQQIAEDVKRVEDMSRSDWRTSKSWLKTGAQRNEERKQRKARDKKATKSSIGFYPTRDRFLDLF